MADLQALRERVQQEIDRQATAVEAVHHSIAAQLFGRIGPLLPQRLSAGDLEELHRKGISGLYEAIRTLNQAIADTLGIVLEVIHRQLKGTE
jgi:hypothetical protein